MLRAIWQLLGRILLTLGGPYVTPPMTVPGLTTGSAYAANDAFGTLFWYDVPKRGVINAAFYYDLDNEKIAKEFVLSPVMFTPTANDSAFAPVGGEIKNFITIRITAGDFGTGFNANAIGQVSGLGIPYVAPEGRLWCQLITRGVDNIAAGSLPRVALAIL